MLESKNTPSLIAKCLNLRYQRPELVTEGYSADEVSAFASHFNRPVITPRAAAPLPEGVGYAEAINAGKSKHNEDQVSEGFFALLASPNKVA